MSKQKVGDVVGADETLGPGVFVGAAVGEDARDFLRDGGLLRDVQDADGGHLGVAAAAERDPSPAAAQRPAVLGGAQFGCQENLKKTN